MKKIMTLMALLLLPMSMIAQENSVIVPGNGNIDVEQFISGVNTDMDISNLSLYELQVLKYAPGARQGINIKEAEIRNIYLKTNWYYEKASNRYFSSMDDNVKMPPVKYTEKEKQFISRVEKREKELLKNNFLTGQFKVNTDNLANAFDIYPLNDNLNEKLKKNGFAIVEDTYDQLFQIYDDNNYKEMPNFVTTDLYLQAFHTYFDSMLRMVEENVLKGRMLGFCMSMKEAMRKAAVNTANLEVKDIAQWNEAYFAVAIALLKDKPIEGLANNKYKDQAKVEIAKVMAEEMSESDFLEYTPLVPYTYNLYRPRGHYSRSESLKQYFRAMMWLQHVPFGSEKPHQMKRVALIAETITKTPGMNEKLHSVIDPITFIMGEPDNVGIFNIQDIMKKNNLTFDAIIQNEDKYNILKNQVEELDKKMTRIKPKFLYSSPHKVNLMPQRYMPDAEVLQEMIDVKNFPTLRGESKALDYFAAMGSTTAEKILIDELKEAQKWDKYQENLNRMKKRMAEIDWNSTIANAWVENLNEMLKDDPAYPYFMKSYQWDKKNLNAALASYAEMKHDAILYAKQPFMAEAGDGEDLEPPVVKGYVEPNIYFWEKALQLITNTQKAFVRLGLKDKKVDDITQQMKEQVEFFLKISRKELNYEKITDEEYDRINGVGPMFEYLTLQMIMNDEQEPRGWYFVQGADKKVALVADVLTANGDNNPDKTVLYEAVGPANEIYVVVEIQGKLYLTRGAVFSYREFSRDMGEPRLTDEEWQESLKTKPNEGVPVWMNEIIIPRGDMESRADVYQYEDYDGDDMDYEEDE